MNQFKLNKITGALIAAGFVLPAGYAVAQQSNTPTVSATDRGPRTGAINFVGGGVAKMRITSTTTAAEAAGGHQVQVFCAVGTTAVTPSTYTIADTDAGTASQTFVDASAFLNACVGSNTAVGTGVILVYDTSATGTAGDFIAGTTSQFAAVQSNGTVAALGGGTDANVVAQAAATLGGTGVHAVRAGYTGPIITSSAGSATGAATLTFSAALSGTATGTGSVGGANTAPTAAVTALKSINGAAINSAIGGGTAAAAAGVETLSVGAANFGGGTYTSAVNKVAVASGTANIFDTAGNQMPANQTVYNTFSNTSGVAAASSGATAIVTGLTAPAGGMVDVWNPTLSGSGATAGLVITLRFNEAVNALGTSAISITAPLTAADGGAANGTDRLINVTIPGGSQVGLNTAGALLVSSNGWASSTPVTLGVVGGTVGNVSVTATGTTLGTGGIAAVAVVAGSVTLPSIRELTLDSNIDGMLDGVTVRTFDSLTLTYGAASPSLATAAGSGLTLVADAGTATLASTVTVNSTTQVNVVLNVLTSGNDWDGDGDVDAADTAGTNYNLTTMGTGVTNPLYRLRKIGVNPTTGAAGINYVGAARPSDGASLPLNNTEGALTTTSFTDNAAPVVMSVVYTSVGTTGQVFNGLGRDAFGSILVTHSESIEGPVNLGSFLFTGTPSTLENLNANIHNQVESSLVAGVDPFSGNAFGGSGVQLDFMPATTVGKVLSYPTATGAVYPVGYASNVNESGGTAAPDYLAVANVNATNNTVGQAPATTSVFTNAVLATGFQAGSKIALVIVNFTQPVAAQGNMNGMFIVRARVGEARSAIFQNRDPNAHGGAGTSDSQDAFYDFIIPATHVAFGTNGVGSANSITITIPDNTATKGLPSDTTEVWVDYQPNGNNRVVRASDSAAIAVGDGMLAFTNVGDAEIAVTADPQTNTINPDQDTWKVNVPRQFLANNAATASKQILTQTVGGKVEFDTNVPLPVNAGVRADLIQVVNVGTKEGGQQDAILLSNDGTVSINRGPNSETGVPQIIALRNNGGLVAADINGLYQALRNYNAGLKAKGVKAGMAPNQVYSLMKAETEALRKYDLDVFGQIDPLNFGHVEDASIRGFIEITTGAGALASSGSNGANVDNAGSTDGVPYSQNANAEFGRTATLTKNLPNVQRNGTTYYPVRIWLSDGRIEPSNGSGDANINWARIPVRAGNPFPADSSETCEFRVLDTAFSLVTVQGTTSFYSVTVGSAEAAFANAGGPLTEAATNSFVQISARHPTTGKYVLLTSADASFAKHIKFLPDLKNNGKLTVRNFELDDVASIDVKDSAGWQLLGIVGELDRNTAGPLDPRAFLSVRDDTGAPITNFSCDSSAKDEAFVLGTDAAVPNSVKVAFEGAGGTLVNNLRPSKAAGIAFNANATGKSLQQNTSGASALNTTPGGGWDDDPISLTNPNRTAPRLFLPIKPGSIATLPKLLKNSWHLLTVQVTGKTFATLHAGVDAAIIVDGVNGATAWFENEPATAHLNTRPISQGTAIFIHTGNADIADGQQL